MMRFRLSLFLATLAVGACAGSNGTGVGGNKSGSGGAASSGSGGSTPSGTGGRGSGGAAPAGAGGVAPNGGGGSPAVGSGGGASGGTNGGGAGTGAGSGGRGGSAAGAGGSAGTGMPVGNADAGTDTGTDAGKDPHPLIAVLPQFTAPDVPVRGPMESPPTPLGWTPPATLPVRVGNGIGQHPLLYVGENYNRILMTNEGKVIWTYDTAPGFELDDIWMLSNGHILYSHMTFIEEITPKKEVVWHLNAAAGTEIHTCQPIGLDKVLIARNGTPPMAIIINKTTGAVEMMHELPGATAAVHGQFRRIRMTAAGTILASYLDGGKVVEYDTSFNVIWTYVTPRPWSAVRLHNGNTLIQDETQSASKEVSPSGQVVWQLAKTDIAFPAGTATGNTQTSERLASGNTVLFTHGTGPTNIQAVEVTPAKQVVWILQDWIHLGDATAAQFLDEPGIPEVPGDTEH